MLFMRNNITIALLLLVVPGVAFAEEATIQVPFDYSGQSCNFDEVAVEYHCTWQSVQDPFTLEDLEEFRYVLGEELYAEEHARLTYVEPVVVPETSEEERLIKSLELKLEQGTIKTPEAVLLNMIRVLDECHQGLGNSAALQTERTFTTSEYAYWHVTNVPVDGYLGDIVKAVEECKAQQVLENKVISVQYANMYNGDEDITYDHYKAFDGLSAIPYEQYTKSDFRVDVGVICNSHAYPDTYKQQMGCDVQYDGIILDKTDGVISYESDTLTKFQLFMNSYGNIYATESDKQVQADIAEPVAREMIESNHFWKNHQGE